MRDVPASTVFLRSPFTFFPLKALPQEWPDPWTFNLEFFFLNQDFSPFLICYNLHSTSITTLYFRVLQLLPDTAFVCQLDCKTGLRLPNLHQPQTLAICDLDSMSSNFCFPECSSTQYPGSRPCVLIPASHEMPPRLINLVQVILAHIHVSYALCLPAPRDRY